MAGISAIAVEGIHVPAYAGLHKQAPRAQGRSSVAPPVVGASAPRAGKPSRSATPLASPRRRRARPHLPKIPGGMVCLTPWLRQPASGLPAQLRVPAAQSPSAPLRARFAVTARAPQAPYQGLAPQGSRRTRRTKRTLNQSDRVESLVSGGTARSVPARPCRLCPGHVRR